MLNLQFQLECETTKTSGGGKNKTSKQKNKLNNTKTTVQLLWSKPPTGNRARNPGISVISSPSGMILSQMLKDSVFHSYTKQNISLLIHQIFVTTTHMVCFMAWKCRLEIIFMD